MGLADADAVRRIEADPAEIGHLGLGPGMAGILVGDAVGAVEIAGDIAGRDPAAAAGGDEDVRQVLADAAAQREGFRRRRGRVGRLGIENDLAVKRCEQRCRPASGSIPKSPMTSFAKSRIAPSAAARLEFAQVEKIGQRVPPCRGRARASRRSRPRRDADGQDSLSGPSHEKACMRLPRLSSPGRRRPSERRLDAPTQDVLAVVVARGQPQHLDEPLAGSS